jgi:type VII secretion integral membrane protein EccD
VNLLDHLDPPKVGPPADIWKARKWSMNITGLVRVTVAAPQRRLDLALPEQASVAEIIPGLLSKAGEHLADEAVPDGGWSLRRLDGSELALGRTLGFHRVRDGEILHLVPRTTDWPELEYDDLVDAVASGSGRLGAAWSSWHTRAAGLAVAAVAVLTGFTIVFRTGAPWANPAGWLLLLALLLVATGVTLSRAVGDSGAGVVMGGLALPAAAVGGGLVLAGDGAFPAIGAPQLLAGSAALLLTGVVCAVGIVDGATLFAGAVTLGALGAGSGWVGSVERFDGTDAAAIAAGALITLSPALGSLAIRLGRVPMPILPRTTADLVRDDPQPPRWQVYGAVVRADSLLTGLLIGTAVVLAVCEILLALDGSRSATILAALTTAGCLIRARLYPIVKQRLTFLTAGLVGATALILGPLSEGRANPVSVVLPLMVLVAAGAIVVGLRYAARPPTPYLGRWAEILEILLTLAVVPVVCGVLGLYGLLRGWGG